MMVGDKEHAEIIRLYVEEGLGMNKIAEQIGRSSRITPSNIFINITAKLKQVDSALQVGG